MARLLDSVSADFDNDVWVEELITTINEYVTYNPKGAGSPEGVVTAPLGAIYRNETGGANVSIYVKESESVSGVQDDTGWVAK